MLQTQFQTMAQQSVFDKISYWLNEMFGEEAHRIEDEPAFGIAYGSAVVFVRVIPWSDDDAIVRVSSPVTNHSAMTGELAFSLVRLNNDLLFGAFSISEAGTVVLAQNLLGSTCDKDELKHAVGAVATTADEYDDKIKASWGGARFADL